MGEGDLEFPLTFILSPIGGEERIWAILHVAKWILDDTSPS